MSREDILKRFYTEECDESSRLTGSNHQMVEFLTTMRYIERYLKPGCRILEIGAGTGRYSLELAAKGFTVDSVELVEHNLEVLRSGIKPGMNITAEQGDALDLSRFEEGIFDIVLVLGPLYHLYSPEDIHRAIDEAIRVTKREGIIMFAYLTNDSIMLDWALKNHHLVDGYGTSFDSDFRLSIDEREVFSCFYIQEFLDLMSAKSVSALHNVATDGMASHLKERIDDLTQGEFDVWMEYHLSTCERRELQGYSNHMLFVCRKQ